MIEYLALPYTHRSERVMAERASVSDFIFSELTKEGRIVYAPISSCHHIAVKHGLPRDWQFWKNMGTAFVGASVKMVVIPLPGWESSVGLSAELELCRQNGVEVEFLDLKYYMRKLGQVRRGDRC